MSWVWKHSQSGGTDRLVLLAIADCANDEGENAWPSMQTLCKKTGLSERTVQGRIQALCALGELTVELRAGKHGTNLYRVLMPEQLTLETPQNLHPAESAPPQDLRVNPAESAPNPSRTVLTPQPPASRGAAHCDKHGRRRRGCKPCDYANTPKPPWCGSCHESTRRLEDLDGNDLGPCQVCHWSVGVSPPASQLERVS